MAPINVKFGTGSGPLPCTKFHVHWGRNVGIQPPKLSKFRILVINLLLRGHSFAQFLRNSQILYASKDSFKFLIWSLSGDKQPSYKHFPAVGAFSIKISLKRTDRLRNLSKKTNFRQNRSRGLPVLHCLVGDAY